MAGAATSASATSTPVRGWCLAIASTVVIFVRVSLPAWIPLAVLKGHVAPVLRQGRWNDSLDSLRHFFYLRTGWEKRPSTMQDSQDGDVRIEIKQGKCGRGRVVEEVWFASPNVAKDRKAEPSVKHRHSNVALETSHVQL